jgi:hypothetical protein
VFLLLIFNIVYAAENCSVQESLTVPIGNGQSLRSTVSSVVFRDKIYNSLHYLIQVTGNAEVLNSKLFITQKELNELLRYITVDDLNYYALVQMKKRLITEIKFLELNDDQQKDAIKILEDIISVKGKMEEDKVLYNIGCKFSFTDKPQYDFLDDVNLVKNRTVSAVCKKANK